MNIGFIGAGNMAYAIVKGIAASDMKLSKIRVYDKNKDQYRRFMGLAEFDSSISELAKNSDNIVLAVKPQNFTDVMAELKPLDLSGKLIITIAAGISSDYICGALDKKLPVVRVMPNTPLMVGFGAAAVSKNDYASNEQLTFVKSIFEQSGIAQIFDETMMNAVIAVNGSSPAYFYLLIKSMIDGAAALGFKKEEVRDLILATAEGSLKMLKQSELDEDELIKMVASPGGTTLAALETLDKNGFSQAVIAAMEACTRRADELSR